MTMRKRTRNILMTKSIGAETFKRSIRRWPYTSTALFQWVAPSLHVSVKASWDMISHSKISRTSQEQKTTLPVPIPRNKRINVKTTIPFVVHPREGTERSKSILHWLSIHLMSRTFSRLTTKIKWWMKSSIPPGRQIWLLNFASWGGLVVVLHLEGKSNLT